MYLITSEQMQRFDRKTIEDRQIPGIVLMELAGKAAAERVRSLEPRVVVVLCGKGNNGGDGWIVARWLAHWGIEVHVLTIVPLEALRGEAQEAARSALTYDIPVHVGMKLGDCPVADVYVDAILGTGTRRGLEGEMAELVESVNRISPCTISIDVPTGVNATTGEVPTTSIRAAETVAFAYAKLGTAISPGCHAAGEVHVADIGIAGDMEQLACLTGCHLVDGVWPNRPNESHKGTYGRVGIVQGSMQGASLLAAMSAARVGAGLVVVAGRHAEPGPWDFVYRRVNGANVDDSVSDCTSVVVGPGLGSDDPVPSLPWFGQRTGVLDADGLLRLFAAHKDAKLTDRWVLTPHPKECAELLGWSTEQVQAHRLEAATTLAQTSEAVVVLKGYHALVVHPSGKVMVNQTGNSSLAVAGTGDVLAGMIGGLLAQGLPAFTAAGFGLWLHGKAGELAGQRLTPVSTMASDVIDDISRAIMISFDKIPGN